MGDPLDAQTWVMTGAAGLVGSGLRAALSERVGRLRLLDVAPVEPRQPNEETIAVDLRDQAGIEAAMVGAHGVVHLGGIADEADFHDLAEVNIVGTFHVLEAARRAGASRVVYASSNRITGFYPTTSTVDVESPPRPDGVYGVAKVAGEALARLYVDKFGLDVVCLRIGSYEREPLNERHLSTWLSPADCVRAVLAAMTAPDVGFAVCYAVSANSRGWWSLDAGRRIGFEPQDDAEMYADRLAGADPPGPQGGGAPTVPQGGGAPTVPQRGGAPTVPQGGGFASVEYTLDRQRNHPL